jgi:hypothetical protein
MAMKLHKRLQFWQASGLLTIDIVFFSLTDPLRVPSALIIIGWLLLAITLYAGSRWLIGALSAYGLPVHKRPSQSALILSGIVSGLLALQSIGQLTTRDVVVLTPLTVVAYLYFSYGEPARETS